MKGDLSEAAIGVLAAAARRELYRVPLVRPIGDVWTCVLGNVGVTARPLLVKQFIRLADDVCWLPRVDARYRSRMVGDGRVEVWTITALGWAAVAQSTGDIDGTRRMLGPAPRDHLRVVKP